MQRAALMDWFKHNPVKVFLLILILVSASVAVVFAYSELLSSKTVPQASIEYFPVKVSIALDKTCFFQGENVKVTLKLKNIADHTINITLVNEMVYLDEEGEHHRLFFTFVVTDENEEEVFDYVWNLGAMGSIELVELNASEEICNILYWNQRRSPEETSVPSGTYYIRGLAPPRGSFLIDAEPAKVETPKIQFKIIG
ncbi:hypothetical protein HXY33_07090 [Candidatus Bathyarchaeota archaeon]|nr:hypothetical protein [Candidatus Bathyarchaeota archaeon]